MSESNHAVWEEMPQKSAFPDWPWATILFQPRKTIRAIVDSDPRRHVIPLMIAAGIAQGLANAGEERLGASLGLAAVLLLAVILGALGGLAAWAIGGAIYTWTGNLLGGEAERDDVRAAMAWSAVPLILSLILLLPMLALYGNELFTAQTPRIDANPLPFVLYGLVETGLALWWYFLFWKCYAEVCDLSLGRAFVAAILPSLVLMLLGVGCLAVTMLDQQVVG